MITLSSYMAGIEAIAAEHPSYKLGADGSGGGCDCVGLSIGAIRRAGGKWTGIHGSNYGARNELEYLLPLTDSDDLTVGECVLKAHRPGESGYALPSRYDRDPDRNDYYHWGVVTSVHPLRITHCTTPGGIREDTKLGKWTYRGWLKQVEGGGQAAAENQTQKEEISSMAQMMVTAERGSTVKMRAKPSTGSGLYWDVPIGTLVEAGETKGGWTAVAWGGHQGYMMAQYLQPVGGAAETETVTVPTTGATAGSSLPDPLEDINRRLNDATAAIEDINRNLGMIETRLAALDGGLG